MTELRQCDEHAKFMEGIGWRVEEAGGVKAYIRGLGLPVSVMKIQRVPFDELNFEWIKEISRKHRVFSVYVELMEKVKIPVESAKANEGTKVDFGEWEQKMRKRGFVPVKNGMLATKTQVIDLKSSAKAIKQKMKNKTRYNLGLAERKGLKTKVFTGDQLIKEDNLRIKFQKIIKENAHRVGYWAIPERWIEKKLEAYGKKAWVVFVYYKNEVVAAALFLNTDTTCFYSFNGSTAKGRLLFAPTLAIWTAIKKAKGINLMEFDFDGVFDERLPNMRWSGYTRFKLGFGGSYVYYPKAFMKWLPGLTLWP